MCVRRTPSTVVATLALMRPALVIAQTPTAPGATMNIALPAKPTYTFLSVETTVSKPIAQVWARVGGYTGPKDWVPIECTIQSGKDNDPATVRICPGTEVLVGKSKYSYTYAQPPQPDRPYLLYHGTLEARPITPTTTKLIYIVVYDNSLLPDDAAREKDRASRAAGFTTFLNNMKILCECGVGPSCPPIPPLKRGIAGAQTAIAPNGTISMAIPAKPTYNSVSVETTVNQPIAQVWDRVGGFSAARDWVPIECTIESGKDNDPATVRICPGIEVLVGKSQYSYTYAWPAQTYEGRLFNLYHGTLEARSITPMTTKLIYTLVFDDSMQPAAARENKASRQASFSRYLNNMKILVECGVGPSCPPIPPLKR